MDFKFNVMYFIKSVIIFVIYLYMQDGVHMHLKQIIYRSTDLFDVIFTIRNLVYLGLWAFSYMYCLLQYGRRWKLTI